MSSRRRSPLVEFYRFNGDNSVFLVTIDRNPQVILLLGCLQSGKCLFVSSLVELKELSITGDNTEARPSTAHGALTRMRIRIRSCFARALFIDQGNAIPRICVRYCGHEQQYCHEEFLHLPSSSFKLQLWFALDWCRCAFPKRKLLRGLPSISQGQKHPEISRCHEPQRQGTYLGLPGSAQSQSAMPSQYTLHTA